MSNPAHHILDVYAAHLHLATSDDHWRVLFERFEEALDEDPGGQGSTSSVVDTAGPVHVLHIVIYIDRASHSSRPELVNTIAHEATHAACQILDHIQEQPTGDTEARAYLTGWIAGWIWKHHKGDK